MKDNTKIVVFTGNRAEYGQLKYLIELINNSKNLELKLFVSGSHLSKRYGNTFSEINNDNLKVDRFIHISLDVSPPPTISELTAEVIKGMSQSLEEVKPNICILLGDRYETFAAATACHLNKVPCT